jgi:hypothetical protein
MAYEEKNESYNPVVLGVALVVVLLLAGVANAQDRTELNTTLMESTFMIEGQIGQASRSLGTVFIMGRPYPNQTNAPNQLVRVRYVLITAAHVLQEIQGDSAILHLRHKIDTNAWTPLVAPIPIRANGQPLWTKNPDADVAAMYISIPNGVTMTANIPSTDLLADDAQLSKFEIHPGDELYCLGYPFGTMSNAAGFPILRSGKIASYPLLPTDQTKSFLFDFRVFKGNSGGPVYLAQSDRVYGGAAHLGESLHFIMGLVSEEATYNEQLVGQYSAELHQFQLGLAVVVHASLIKKTVEMLPSPDTLPD